MLFKDCLRIYSAANCRISYLLGIYFVNLENLSKLKAQQASDLLSYFIYFLEYQKFVQRLINITVSKGILCNINKSLKHPTDDQVDLIKNHIFSLIVMDGSAFLMEKW